MSFHSARHSVLSSADSLSRASGSRSPAKSGSARQCVNVSSASRFAAGLLSSFLHQAARSSRSHWRACLRQRVRSASSRATPSSPCPTLQALAPTQSEPPFLVTQVLLLGIFAALAIAAVIRFRNQPVRTA